MKKIIFALALILLLLPNAFALNVKYVEITPTIVEPGNRATINLKIENSREQDLENIIIKLDFSSPDLPISPAGSSTATIDKLREDDKEDVEFDIIVLPDAKSGIYKIPILIEYEQEETYEINGTTVTSLVPKQEQDVISITINSQPTLKATIEEPDFIIGNKAKIKVKIINQGISDVQFLTLGLADSNFFDTISSNEVYIGNLDSDDYDIAEFEILLKNNIPKNLPITINLDYRDGLNNHKQESQNAHIKLYTEQEAINLGLIQKNNTSKIIGIIVLILVLFIIYRKIKKRKR